MNVLAWAWSLAEIDDRQTGALAFMLRWREVPAAARRSEWPISLHITWENRFSTPEGFPVPSEMEAMGVFEERLGGAVEGDALAVMSLSVTGGGKRVLLFHTRDLAAFSQRLHEIPQEEAPYPITIGKTDDPEWRGFDGVFEDFGMSAPQPSKSLWQRLRSALA